MKTRLLLSAVLTMFLLAGCILSDELTTLTIRPDGSADWIKFRSNSRSSETGDKREQELLKYIDEFETHAGADFVRIAEAGGELLEARWVQREEPYATLIAARFPTAASLERFWTIKGDKGVVLAQARFTQDSNRRRLSLTIPGPRENDADGKEPLTVRKMREQQANGISETRIAVAQGHIVATEGFVVADDKRSCLVDPIRIDEVLRNTSGPVNLFLEWEVEDK